MAAMAAYDVRAVLAFQAAMRATDAHNVYDASALAAVDDVHRVLAVDNVVDGLAGMHCLDGQPGSDGRDGADVLDRLPFEIHDGGSDQCIEQETCLSIR